MSIKYQLYKFSSKDHEMHNIMKMVFTNKLSKEASTYIVNSFLKCKSDNRAIRSYVHPNVFRLNLPLVDSDVEVDVSDYDDVIGYLVLRGTDTRIPLDQFTIDYWKLERIINNNLKELDE